MVELPESELVRRGNGLSRCRSSPVLSCELGHPPKIMESSLKDIGRSIWDKVIDMVSPDSRKGLEGLTALVVLALVLIFCHIFIIPLNLFENWPNLVLYLAAFVIFYVVRVLLFSSDVLYYGDPERNRYAKAFQMYWPSRHLASRFKLSQEDASFYWFEKVFNGWADPSHPRNSQWRRTLIRGYSCRFVYYCVKFLEILLWISLGVTLLHEIVPRLFGIDVLMTSISLGWRIGFLVFVALLYIVTRSTNRTSPTNLTGVWRRYAEINKMHIRWIDENISSLDDLRNLAP